MSPPENHPIRDKCPPPGLPVDDTYRDRKNDYHLPVQQKARIPWRTPQADERNLAMKQDYAHPP